MKEAITVVTLLLPGAGPLACTPTHSATVPTKPESLALRETAANPEPVQPTSLMNPGDEVDDNIWARRPRNRLQPGQTTAPASPTPARTIAAKEKVPGGASAAGAADGATASAAGTVGAVGTSTIGGAAAADAVSGDRGLDDAGAAVIASSAAKGSVPGSPAPMGSVQGARPASTGAPSAPRAATPPPSTPSSKPVPAAALPSAPEPPARSGGTVDGQPTWSIALATFSGDDHRVTAEAARRLFAQHLPELGAAVVRSTASGSVVLWGEFDGPRDPRARPELDRLKLVTIGDGRPFAKAMLVRLEQFSEQELHPWDLRQVRRRHPNVRVLYTLQIAAWSDLGSGAMGFDEIRRSAEAYCRQIRAEGAEAWFHHDGDLKTSIVTVGVFDHRAYDPQSTLFAPEVETLRRRYPNSLLNGAELLIKPDPNRPDYAVPQPSRLVEVPR